MTCLFMARSLGLNISKISYVTSLKIQKQITGLLWLCNIKFRLITNLLSIYYVPGTLSRPLHVLSHFILWDRDCYHPHRQETRHRLNNLLKVTQLLNAEVRHVSRHSGAFLNTELYYFVEDRIINKWVGH